MLKVLIKKQMMELFQSYFVDKKTGKARTTKGTISFFLLFIGLFISLACSFYSMASTLGEQILNNGINWLYFVIQGLISIALGVFASVFNTYSSLYLPKDNELLLSLPIKSKSLVLSRLFGVYLISLMYTSWIWIPVIIVYYNLVPLTFTKVLFPILLTFIISLFVTFLSSILGYIVAIISYKTKGNNFIKVFFSLFIMAFYYVVYYKLMGVISNIGEYLDTIGDWSKNKLHYLYLLGNAADGKIISMLLFSLITFILFGICLYILNKSFIKLTVFKDNGGKSKNKTISYKSNSISKTLLNREYKMFTSYTTWMLNGGLGLLIMPIITIILLVKKQMILDNLNIMLLNLPNYLTLLPVLILLGICIIISTNCILPCSISIEGKSLWILQSLPINSSDVLKNKEKMYVQMNLIASLPLVIVLCLIFNIETFNILLIVLGIVLFTYVYANYSLMLNLLKPNLSWTNVTNIVKQSLPVMIALFSGWFFCILVGFLSIYFIKSVDVTMILEIIICLLVILLKLLQNWIKKKGTIIFNSL